MTPYLPAHDGADLLKAGAMLCRQGRHRGSALSPRPSGLMRSARVFSADRPNSIFCQHGVRSRFSYTSPDLRQRSTGSFPCRAGQNRNNVRNTGLVSSSQQRSGNRCVAGVLGSDLEHLHLCQFHIPLETSHSRRYYFDCRAVLTSTFCNSIGNVVVLRSAAQMIRTHTRRVVAAMHHLHVLRNRAMRKRVGDAMSSFLQAGTTPLRHDRDREKAVAGPLFWSKPWPTACLARPIDLGPESRDVHILDWDAIGGLYHA